MGGFMRRVLLAFDAMVAVVEHMLTALGISQGIAETVAPLVAIIGCMVVVAVAVRLVTALAKSVVQGRGLPSSQHPSDGQMPKMRLMELPHTGKVHPSFVPSSASELYRRFKDDPTAFEQWCAELMGLYGHRTEVTPPTNDGGLDVRMFKGRSKAIAECKCYRPYASPKVQKVGRELVQKLVGANAVEQADSLVFMTTSTYTSTATRYAEEQNILLLSGDDLVRMASGG